MTDNKDLDENLDENLEENVDDTSSENLDTVSEDDTTDWEIIENTALINPFQGTNIVPLSIEKEISESYIEYAMSVIISRALPDTRDWFKPVLRRILYAMYQMKIFHNVKHKKSARIVGEVLWKYHPHGDSSVYEAMVRMAQDWSLRYPLVDGQGNFWSIDGDGAAAHRYTEARLTAIAEEMLRDIEKDTVRRKDNFDWSEQEPVTLPTKFPNHLCNGTMGIAVGMATNMPPHNLTEVIDASIMFVDNPQATVDDIMDIIQWPDFPTWGYIFDREQIKEVYRKWKGPVAMRWKTHIEENSKEKIIVVTEIPYQVNKARLIEKMAELVIDKKIEWITDIRDESAKNKIRIAIYIKKTSNEKRILLRLFKSTELQTNFNVNNVTLIDKGTQPSLLNIRDLIKQFVDYRRIIVLSRTKFDLRKAIERLHILEWLKKAIDIIDEVIETIKKSSTKADAKQNLMDKYEFSDVQAEYILLMRLQSLVGLEIERITDEINEKIKAIAELEEIINNPHRLNEVVKEEMNYIKNKFGDERRTELVDDKSAYDLKKLLQWMADKADLVKEDVIVWISDDYTIRCLYQTRTSYIPDETQDIIYTHNQDKLIIMTDIGELVVERVKDFGSFTTKSHPLDLKKHFWLKWNIVFAKTLHFDYDHLVFLTNQNNIKKIEKNVVLWFKKFPTTIMKLPWKWEKIVSIKPTLANEHIWVVTEQGKLLLFPEANIRPMWKTSGGVTAIDLEDGDKPSDMMIYKWEPFILVYWEKKWKILSFEDLRVRKRAKKWQIIAELAKWEKIRWIISIEEWAVRIKNDKDEYVTIHSNDITLDMPESPLDTILKTGTIVHVFRPWEEKTENMQYKEDKKNNPEEADEDIHNESLFEQSEDDDSAE